MSVKRLSKPEGEFAEEKGLQRREELAAKRKLVLKLMSALAGVFPLEGGFAEVKGLQRRERLAAKRKLVLKLMSALAGVFPSEGDSLFVQNALKFLQKFSINVEVA